MTTIPVTPRAMHGDLTTLPKLTEGFRLPARVVVHTVGPVWHGGTQGKPAREAGRAARARIPAPSTLPQR